MVILKIFLSFVLVFNLISCATIINGSTENVSIFASAEGTQVFINEVFMGKAGPDEPVEVTIPKRGRVEFAGKKEGCEDGEEVVRRTVDPTTFLGLFIDLGLVSILFVDILGTNAFVHANQKSYVLELNCRS